MRRNLALKNLAKSLTTKEVRCYTADIKPSLNVCPVAEEKEGIEDRTATNLTNLRRVIYLTIMNALNYEEAVHKLLKVQLSEGQEVRHRV